MLRRSCGGIQFTAPCYISIFDDSGQLRNGFEIGLATEVLGVLSPHVVVGFVFGAV